MGPSTNEDDVVTTFLKTHLAVHPYDNQRTRGAHRDKLEAAKKFQALALERRSKEAIRRADGYWDSCKEAFEEVQQQELLVANNDQEQWQTSSTALQQLQALLLSTNNHHSTFLPSDFGLLKKLGQGGYGAVYKAVHYPTGHIVALKEVDAGSSPVETRDQRTLPLECGIVPCYGTFLGMERTRVRKRTTEAVPKLKTWMVLKHCRKGSLADKLKEKGSLGRKEAAHVVKRLAKILTPLYEEHGLVHNDIKPANILYDGSNTLLLCDLGCARKGPWLSTGPRLGGTYAHMSPEKLLQRKLNTNGGCCYYNQDKIDVWAMGILLCQMVTGGEHPCAAIRKFVQLPSLQEGEDPEQLYGKLEDCFSKLTLPTTTTNDPQLKRLLQEMLALDCGERLSIHEIKQQPWIQRHDKWTKKVAMQLKTTTTRLGTLLGPRVSPVRKKKDDMAQLGEEEASATEATTTCTSMGLSSRGISSLRRLNIALGGPEQDVLPSI